MTLIAAQPNRPSAAAGGAFATPTIVHFCAVLFLAAALRTPWKTVLPVAILWGLIGLGGIIYAVIVIRRMKAQTVYKPELEDWIFYFLLPLAAYIVLTLSTLTASAYLHESLFAVAASMLLLLFAGIRNSWDNVAYHVFDEEKKTNEDSH